MDTRKPSPTAGKRLKALRESLGLTARDVEEKSKQIAKDRDNEEYHISHSFVTDIESGKYTPSIYKVYTFSAVYQRPYDAIVSLFGLGMSDLKRYQALFWRAEDASNNKRLRAARRKGVPPRAL